MIQKKNPDRQWNKTASLFGHVQPLQKIYSKYVHNIRSNHEHKHADLET